jgi:uncharacterized phage-associated protein
MTWWYVCTQYQLPLFSLKAYLSPDTRFHRMISFRESNTELPNLDKIGNLIVYLVDEIKRKHKQNTYLTKLLKLLYIIDETSVKETGAPVTGLDYRVWKMGPVAYDVYKDFVFDDSNQFATLAEGKKSTSKVTNNDIVKIESVNHFDDSEFSDYEMELIDTIVDKFGHFDGEALINLLHEKGSLWDKIVEANKLMPLFEKQNTTDLRIDLSQVLEDPHKKELFRNSKDSLTL